MLTLTESHICETKKKLTFVIQNSYNKEESWGSISEINVLLGCLTALEIIQML